MRPLGYRPALDGIRAIAIALVVAFHAWGQPHGGLLGVDLFFVLSGFLITTLLLEERDRRGSISLGAFYLRRVLRLVPALVVYLAVATAVSALRHGVQHGLLIDALAGVTFTSNLVQTAVSRPPTYPQLWSLGVEEQFYLTWPVILAVALAHRWPIRRAASMLVLAALAIAVARSTLAWPPGPHVGPGPASVLRFDSILLGCAAALAYRNTGRIRALSASRFVFVPCVIGIALVVAIPYQQRVHDGTSFVVALLSAVALLGVVQGPGAGVLSLAPLVWLGQISYSLYLWHLTCIGWMQDAGAGTVAGVALAVAVAALSTFTLERYFLRLKSRLRRAPSGDALAAGHA